MAAPNEVADDGYEVADDGWCLDCTETFRYDDTGGYNPPCACGIKCRDCCEGRACELDEPVFEDDPDEPDDA